MDIVFINGIRFLVIFIYLFGVLRRFQHCTGLIMKDSWEGRGNQYIQLVKVLYSKLPANGKQLPAFPVEVMLGTEPWGRFHEKSQTEPDSRLSQGLKSETFVWNKISCNIYLFIWGFTSLSTLYRSYHEG